MDPAVRASVRDYVAVEEASEIKHELIGGQIVAMAGGTRRHSRIIGNLFGELFVALRGSGYQPHLSEQRVHVLATDLDTYPDVSIVCGKDQLSAEDPQAITNPCVIFEVLSPSTETYNRGAKWAHYQRIPSLQEYVLVSTVGEPAMERFRRAEGETWIYEMVRGEGAALALTSCAATLTLAEVYANAPPEE